MIFGFGKKPSQREKVLGPVNPVLLGAFYHRLAGYDLETVMDKNIGAVLKTKSDKLFNAFIAEQQDDYLKNRADIVAALKINTKEKIFSDIIENTKLNITSALNKYAELDAEARATSADSAQTMFEMLFDLGSELAHNILGNYIFSFSVPLDEFAGMDQRMSSLLFATEISDWLCSLGKDTKPGIVWVNLRKTFDEFIDEIAGVEYLKNRRDQNKVTNELNEDIENDDIEDEDYNDNNDDNDDDDEDEDEDDENDNGETPNNVLSIDFDKRDEEEFIEKWFIEATSRRSKGVRNILSVALAEEYLVSVHNSENLVIRYSSNIDEIMNVIDFRVANELIFYDEDHKRIGWMLLGNIFEEQFLKDMSTDDATAHILENMLKSD
jgi:hypothetical protein